MPDRTLQFSDVRLDRILGIRPGQAFALEGFSPGLNLVHGNNGVGKTTVSRALQELIWPGETGLDRPTISGAYTDGADRWELSLDAGHPLCRRNGHAGPPPNHAAPELHRRYRLALDELITTRDADFAAIIARESRGGYDLDRAAEEAGFSRKPSLPKSLSTARDEAARRRRDAGQEQLKRHRDAGRLEELRAEVEAAREAASRVHLLEIAVEHARLARECAELQGKLDAFPAMEGLRGDELHRLDALAEQERDLEQRISATRSRLDDARRRTDACGLVGMEIHPHLFPSLKDIARRLSEHEGKLAEAERELRFADDAAERSRALLGERFPAETPSGDSLREAGVIEDFSERWDAWIARSQSIEEQLKRLDNEGASDAPGHSEECILTGVLAMESWLAAPESEPATADSLPRATWTACAVAALLGLGLAILHHPLWALTLLVPAALLYWENRQRSAAPIPSTDRRTTHRRSFTDTGLPEPPDWSAEAVGRHLVELARMLRRRKLEDERNHERRRLCDQREALQSEREALDRDQETIQSRTGLRIDLDRRWLPLLVRHLTDWQRQDNEAAVLRAETATLNAERDALARDLADRLAPFGETGIENAAIAQSAIDRLETRVRQFDKAAADIAVATRELENQDNEFGRVQTGRTELFEKAGLQDGQREELASRLRRLAEFNDIRNHHGRVSTLRDDLARRLADLPEWQAAAPETIEAELDHLRGKAARKEELSEQIIHIERDIQDAKRGHQLVDAIAAVDRARDALIDRREENLQAVAGATLTDWVRQQTSRHLRPRVLELADRRLVDFTGGAFRLEVAEHDEGPAFLARFGEDRIEPLENLSTGERVQLLIAVRMAFIESVETVRLPLLLDEVLGTSDDHRTEAVIRAVTEIVKSGRQVFYFTAQRDEVEKWRAAWTDPDLPPLCDLDLNQARGLAAVARAPVTPYVPPPYPPAPAGLSHPAYGEKLNVPGVDPASVTVDAVHLWHFLDDVDLLHHLLCRRITTWGAFSNFLDYADRDFSAHHEATLHRARARARLLADALRFRRIGACRPVDRRAVMDAGCVSDVFKDRMIALAEECSGQADRVLHALNDDATRKEKLKGWREGNTAKLEEHFRERGHISDESPLTAEEIRQRLHARAETLLTPSDIERVIALLGPTTPGETRESTTTPIPRPQP